MDARLAVALIVLTLAGVGILLGVMFGPMAAAIGVGCGLVIGFFSSLAVVLGRMSESRSRPSKGRSPGETP